MRLRNAVIDAWKGLKYFKENSTVDKWGDPSKIDMFLLRFLDEFRDSIKTPLIVTSGYRKGSPGQHGLGKAVDVIAPKWEGSLFDLFLISERFGFTGIGLYRDWTYNGRRTGGLHLDTRLVIGNNNPVKKGSRWIGVREGSEGMTKVEDILKVAQVYKPLDLATLRKEGFI